MLIVFLGISIHFGATWASFHQRLLSAKAIFVLLFVYMLAVPFLLWFLRGDRPLRILVLCMWLGYLGLWAYAIRTM